MPGKAGLVEGEFGGGARGHHLVEGATESCKWRERDLSAGTNARGSPRGLEVEVG